MRPPQESRRPQEPAKHAPPAADTVHDGPPSRPGGPAAALPRGTETVLVAEDEPMVMALLTLVLGQLGYTVLAAPDRAEAVRAAGEYGGPIHLLIADVLLAGTAGAELAGRLTACRPGLRVLYLSGLAQKVLLEKRLLDAGSAFLQKPFSLEALAGMIREVLRR